MGKEIRKTVKRAPLVQRSKTQKVLEHLHKRPLTRREAQKRYAVVKLSGIVSALRNRGYKIRTDMVPSGNRFVARYTLG